MKKLRLEAWLDEEFKLMGVKVYVYHIRSVVRMFNGITIATGIRQDIDVLWRMIWELDFECEVGVRSTPPPNQINAPATWMRKELAARGFYDVALCDRRDQFSPKRGRIIAKGRLLKRLRKEGLKRAYREYAFGNCVYPQMGSEE